MDNSEIISNIICLPEIIIFSDHRSRKSKKCAKRVHEHEPECAQFSSCGVQFSSRNLIVNCIVQSRIPASDRQDHHGRRVRLTVAVLAVSLLGFRCFTWCLRYHSAALLTGLINITNVDKLDNICCADFVKLLSRPRLSSPRSYSTRALCHATLSLRPAISFVKLIQI